MDTHRALPSVFLVTTQTYARQVLSNAIRPSLNTRHSRLPELSSLLVLHFTPRLPPTNLIRPTFIRLNEMANVEDIDASQWYHLFVNRNDSIALAGSTLTSAGGTRGAVQMKPTDLTSSDQKWQVYRVNETAYVLRSQDGGANAFLGTKFNETEVDPEKTRPIMVRGDVVDQSAYWSFTDWGDGTYYMTNGANGTGYHLGKRQRAGDPIMYMDPDTTPPQNQQRWSFKANTGGRISNEDFSIVKILGSTVTAPATASSGTTLPSKSSEPSQPSSDANPGGMSSGVKGAIGASVGGTVLIAIIVLGLFLTRKWKRQHKQPVWEKSADNAHEAPHESTTVKYEMNHETAAKHEMPATQYAELPQYQHPVELPSTTVDYNAR